ncbi:MAG: hypothetical protein ABIE94_01985, partial [archaeon]
KPNPLIVRALFDLYKHQTKSSGGRVPKRPRIDVVGNSYVLDVVSANLAKKLLGDEAEVRALLVNQFPRNSDMDGQVTCLRYIDHVLGPIMNSLGSVTIR